MQFPSTSLPPTQCRGFAQGLDRNFDLERSRSLVEEKQRTTTLEGSQAIRGGRSDMLFINHLNSSWNTGMITSKSTVIFHIKKCSPFQKKKVGDHLSLTCQFMEMFFQLGPSLHCGVGWLDFHHRCIEQHRCGGSSRVERCVLPLTWQVTSWAGVPCNGSHGLKHGSTYIFHIPLIKLIYKTILYCIWNTVLFNLLVWSVAAIFFGYTWLVMLIYNNLLIYWPELPPVRLPNLALKNP